MKRTIKIQKVDFYDKLFDKVFGKRLEKYYQLEFTDKPDFLFYSVYDTGCEHYKYSDCVKIFYSTEGVIPDFNECDYGIGSYPMKVGNRYCQIPYNPVSREQLERKNIVAFKDKKFCNFVYSNATNGRGAILRQEFCKELMKYRHVDCPGQVLNNMRDAIEPRNGDWYRGKVEFIKDYKFTIAFENVAMPGMVTEKIIQAFEAGSVPIYWGDSMVTDLFNSNAFINCNDYSNWDEVIERVKELDNDEKKYMDMLVSNPFNQNYDFDYDKKVEQFLCDIIEKGKVIYEKDPLGWDSGRISGEKMMKIKKSKSEKIKEVKKKFFRQINSLMQKI